MSDKDVFDEFFAADGDEPTTETPTEQPAEGAPQTAAEDPLAEGQAAEPAEPAAGEEGGDPAEDEQEVEPGQEPAEPDYKALYAKAEQRFKSFEGRYKKEKEDWERKSTERVAPPAPKEEPKDATPAPEDEFLDKFRRDYNDDVLKAIELVAERKARKLVEEVNTSRIEPLQQAYAKTAQEAHFSAIRNAHGDWEQVVGSDAFQGWVGNQPGFLKAAYQSVLERGTAQDVVDLLGSFKAATTKPATKPTVNPAKVQAAKPVKTPHGTMPAQAPMHQDFHSAWDEAPD